MVSVDQEGRRGHSWIVEILPEMEHQALADRYDKRFSPLHNIMRNNFVITDLPELYCPSRRSSVETPQQQYMLMTVEAPDKSSDPLTKLNIVVGGTDYGAAVAAGNCYANQAKTSFHFGRNSVGNGGLAASPMTPLGPGNGASINKITDGTSETLLLGELQRIWAEKRRPPFLGRVWSRGLHCRAQ